MTLPIVEHWDPFKDGKANTTRREIEAIKKERDEAVELTARLTLRIESLIAVLPENIRMRLLRSSGDPLAGKLPPDT